MAQINKDKVFAQWYEIIKETQQATGVYFDEEIETYLILTLDNYTFDITLLDKPIAIDYLNSLQHSSTYSTQTLRKVGDHCLLISGLFPERAKKILSVRYYVDMGQQAYLSLSDRNNLKSNPALFYNLGLKFPEIKEVLNAMRFIAQSRILN